MPNYTNSVWSETVPAPPHPPLAGDSAVDVAIIGGGLTGVTAALLLQRAGRRVALVESRRIGKGETGKTTAHLSLALDTRYRTLISRFGVDGARLAAEGHRAAIDRIARFTEEERIACDFRRIPGFLYAEQPEEKEDLVREAEAVRRLGIPAALTDDVPLPFRTALGLKFEDQAAFHPRAYLQALADAFVAAGGAIYEETHATDIEEGEPCRVVTDRGVLSAPRVIVAAHVPISNRLMLHTKLAAYRSYAVGIEMPFPTDALFWDMADPYHYIRMQRIEGRTVLIVGGEDHKVGETDDTATPFERLEDYVLSHFDREVSATDYRWSGQIVESVDGLAYVGRNALSSRIFVATGYSGNGMTYATLAAMVLADQLQEKENQWSDLLDATRIKPIASAKAFVAENVDFPKTLVRDRIPLPGLEALGEISPGEGRVLSVRGNRLAVYRNGNGELAAVSAVCTHLGCLVRWNTTDKSWDCPCHGSRFDPHGRILNGPAIVGLEARPLPIDEPETEERAAATAARKRVEQGNPTDSGRRDRTDGGRERGGG
jgi:glycine/D-amino acid oxidase-like deaminating enzyme/nitrite reductase/ring-hydroxylating ferredoxin subunit